AWRLATHSRTAGEGFRPRPLVHRILTYDLAKAELLRRLEAGLGAALDAGGDQLLDLEPMADQFEHPQFLLARLAIGRRHVAGDRIGGLAQFRGQCLSDRFERFVEPVVAA